MKTSLRKPRVGLRRSLATIVSTLVTSTCIVGGAYAAQSSSSPDASAKSGGQELSEVVVTGSRIARRDYQSQSPIVTVQGDSLQDRASVDIEDTLNQLPQFTPAGTAQSNSSASTPFPSPTACPGCATLDLRNLGTNRSLVLLDGRRVQPTGGNLVVDLNTILPSIAIQSVETISGGAAAVYGADAISGVVNFISKKHFQGAQFDGQYGITEHGDGQQYQFSALFGTNYGDGRGNVMFGATYANRGDIKGKDRSWVRAGWNDPGTSAGGVPGSSGLSTFRCSRGASVGGVAGAGDCPASLFLPVNNGAAYLIDQNGNVFDPADPLNTAHPYTGPVGGDSGFKINPDGSLGYFDRENNYLALPLSRYSLFGQTTYDFNDNVSMYLDGHFSQSTTIAHGAHVGLFNIWAIQVPYNAAYDDPASSTFGNSPDPSFAYHPVPASVAQYLNARVLPGGADPTTSPWTYEGGVDYLPAYRTDTTSNVFQLTAGLKGKLPALGDWTWEAYVSQGKSEVNAHLPESFLSLANVQQLFSASQYGAGWNNPQIVAVAGHCTSGLPIFNPDGTVNNSTSVSQDCADYVTLRMNNVSSLQQQVQEATVQGTLFQGWAGPVQFAAGVNHRVEEFAFTPDGAYDANQSTANVVNNIALPLGVDGATKVKEVYAEMAIPVLAGLPFIKKLEIDPGYRISDYNTTGTSNTWKIMGNWQVNDWATLRGGFQHAVRAPNVIELYSPVGASSIDFNAPDACGNWAGTPTWGNNPANANRLNLQTLCQYLMTRDGAPASLYVPGQDSANNYSYNVFGSSGPSAFFPFDLAVQGGNPNLNPEKADTYTVGAVIRSPFRVAALQRLTFSVDYYNIDIKGAIAVPNHQTVYQQCLDAQYNTLIGSAPGTYSGQELADNSPYCALIHREYLPPQFVFGADRKFDAAYVNLGAIKTDGVDVQLDWGSQFADIGLTSVPGAMSVNVQYSYLGSYDVSPFPGGAFVDQKGTGVNYDYKVLTTLGYNVGSFSAGLRWQHLPSVDPTPGSSSNALGVNSHDQFDLFARWAINDRYELRGGIDNLLNADPEVVGATRTLNPDGSFNAALSNNALGSAAPGNDTFGRRFYVGARVSL